MIDPSKITTLIFDFDGTIADTLELHRTIFNQLSQKYHHALIDRADIEQLRNLGLRDFLKKMDIPFYKIPVLIREGQTIAQTLPVALPITGIEPVLAKLSESFSLGIVTSNKQDYCQRFLQHHQLDSYFDFVVAEKDVFGKAHKLKRVLKERHLQPSEVVYIGDEVRDIEAAHTVPMPVIGVAWGFNSEAALQAAGSDLISSSPQDLLSFLTRWQ